MRNRVLLVDDERSIRFAIRSFLEAKGFDVEEADCCQKALASFSKYRPDVCLLDYALPDGNALELLGSLRALDLQAPVIIMTAHASVDLAVRALKEGAENFVTKPVEMPALCVLIKRATESRRAQQKQLAHKSREVRTTLDPFAGGSPAIERLREQCERVVDAEAPVMILGETGVGKGVLARWFHDHGPRREEPFVDLNCAGLLREFLETELFGHERGAFTGAVSKKPGLLEVAHHGTVFLDEIGDMDVAVQPKLLKVLEEKRYRRLGDHRHTSVDIRLIAATHQNLRNSVSDGAFRQDLYYRISRIPLEIPSLRERGDDIETLARSLLRRCAADLGRPDVELSSGALGALAAYSWPGNIRELRNVIERAVLLGRGNVLEAADLHFDGVDVGAGESLNGSKIFDLTLREAEIRHIASALEREEGNVANAAERLGIPRSTLYQKIKRYELRQAATA